MPGFILHLTAAQMLRSHLHEYPDFPYPIQSVNDFLIGNLLPDATDQKELSHFRNPVYRLSLVGSEMCIRDRNRTDYRYKRRDCNRLYQKFSDLYPF